MVLDYIYRHNLKFKDDYRYCSTLGYCKVIKQFNYRINVHLNSEMKKLFMHENIAVLNKNEYRYL